MILINIYFKSSIDKVYRALIPEISVKWISDFVQKNNKNIDVWLSIRLISSQREFYANATSYKYFSEFHVKNFEVIKDELESHQIMIEKIEMNSLSDFNQDNNLSKSKRSNSRDNTNLRERVVGKYAGYDLVSCTIIKEIF